MRARSDCVCSSVSALTSYRKVFFPFALPKNRPTHGPNRPKADIQEQRDTLMKSGWINKIQNVKICDRSIG